jgi:diguanylate cyclase (GGDEF)-like protein
MLKLELELAQASRRESRLAVVHMDLDRFKVINDTLGHSIGDRMILAVAERLSGTIRKNDTLARVGSDEFIILLTDLKTPDDAARMALQIVAGMRRTFPVDGKELYITASVGISIFPDDSSMPEVLLSNADIAVSHVKKMGRNNYQFFNPSINIRTLERLLLESSLRQTIERNQLELYYQPQVDIRTGKIICVEALVRWNHPDLGMLLPAQFIPIAEEIGFITTIDEWVLRTACVQNKAWHDSGNRPLCVTVNISSQQFEHPELIRLVSAVVERTGLLPGYLDIEVTESTAMRDIDLAIPNLMGLNRIGVNISIDDFGTGYSSLNYLKRFPVQTLKIDQSFIRGVATDADDEAIVKAVIAMGHNLRLKVLAEGVETEDQLSFLRDSGCDEMQGFLFSEPLPVGEIERKFG